MKQKIVSSVVLTSLLLFLFVEMVVRHVGSPGVAKIDLCVDESVMLITFSVSFLLAIGLFAKKIVVVCASGLVLMAWPLLLSTRHVYVGGRYTEVDEYVLFNRSIDHGDAEAACFLKDGGFIVALRKGGEIGRFHEGVFLWRINRKYTLSDISYDCGNL